MRVAGMRSFALPVWTAQTDRTHARTDRTHAQTDRTHAQTDRTHAQTDRTHAQMDRTYAQTDRTHAQADRTHAQTDRTHAQTDRTHAQMDRTHAQTDRTYAQTDRIIFEDGSETKIIGKPLVSRQNPTKRYTQRRPLARGVWKSLRFRAAENLFTEHLAGAEARRTDHT